MFSPKTGATFEIQARLCSGQKNLLLSNYAISKQRFARVYLSDLLRDLSGSAPTN